jgi:hypothetical protein
MMAGEYVKREDAKRAFRKWLRCHYSVVYQRLTASERDLVLTHHTEAFAAKLPDGLRLQFSVVEGGEI